MNANNETMPMENLQIRNGWIAIVYAKAGDVVEKGKIRRTRKEASMDLKEFKIDSKLFRKEVRLSKFADYKKPWTTMKERERIFKKRLDRRIKRKSSRIRQRASEIIIGTTKSE